MNYFLTHKLSTPIAAVEQMVIARITLFELHGEPATLVTRDYTRDASAQLLACQLSANQYLNMFDYFQGIVRGGEPIVPTLDVIRHDREEV